MDIEACRLQPAIGDPPPRPPHFDERYVLPVHSDDLILHRVNHHPRDDRIVFYEKPHLYVTNGTIAGKSISSLAHEFEEPFDSILGIRAMQRSKSQAWPRLDYVKSPVKVSMEDIDTNLGVLIHDQKTGITVASMYADPSRNITTLRLVEMLRAVSTRKVLPANEVFYNFEREETDEEIKAKWARNGELARNLGTEAHLMMERWFNSLPVRLDDPEVVVGLEFIRKHLLPAGAKGYKTEWEIFGEEEDVAGSIDLAVILPNGDLYLVDWKRSEKLPTKMKGYSRFKAPLDNLEDCSGCSYAMQLSCYQYIIEKYYGFKVRGRCLVSLHPDKPFSTSVPYLQKEAEYIMSKRRLVTSTRQRLESDPAYNHLKCSKTGRLAEDAVRDSDGTLYWDKTALLHELDAQPCPDTAKEVADLLKKETPLATYPEGLVDWRVQFPKPNEDLFAY